MFKSIVEAYKIWLEKSEAKKVKKEEALNHVRNALQETKIYISELNQGKGSSREKEVELSSLWSEAAIFARKIDPDLAVRLHEKGNYWLNPENYEIENIFERGIHWERIDAEVKEALEYLP
jgi:hypothetical protein